MQKTGYAGASKAPREYYGPRKLLPNCHRRHERRYNKTLNGQRGSEALPDGWNVLCPNRIKEVRMRLGIESCLALVKKLGSINYQRLHKLETGRVVVRDSEFQLIAQCLGVDVTQLTLPLLTQSETVEWQRRWGLAKQIEEGGDHDSVILAAYMRHLVSSSDKSLNRLCAEGVRGHPIPHTTANRMWHAERPIDRYPDNAMFFMMHLSGKSSWDDVVLESRRLYNAQALYFYVDQVRAPRKRYAPEDPDRRAPWTYDIDPGRPKKHRALIQTPLSADPETAGKRTVKETARQKEIREATLRIEKSISGLDAGNITAALRGLFPDDIEIVGALLRDNPVMARTIALRARCIRNIRHTCEFALLGARLGISRERVRQIEQADGNQPGIHNYYNPNYSSNIKLIKI